MPTKHTLQGFLIWDRMRAENLTLFDGCPFYFAQVAPSETAQDLKILASHRIDFEVPDDFDPRAARVQAAEKAVVAARKELEARERELAAMKEPK